MRLNMNKKATIKDVAALAGVSISAVSYILNRSTEKKYSAETVERVNMAARKLNYSPTNIARGMRSQRAHALGVVSFWELDNRVYVKTLEGAINECAKENYSLILCQVNNCPIGGVVPDDFSYIQYYIDKRIDGILFLAPPSIERTLHEQLHIDKMKQVGIPCVVINGETHDPDINYLRYDYRSTTRAAAEYLIKNGHSSIYYISPKVCESCQELSLRRKGFLDAVPYGKIVDIDDVTPERLKEYGAVVTNKSDTALKLINMALDNDIRIPDSLSIVSANVENYSEFLHPPLTCVQLPFGKIGEAAVKLLIGEIDGKTEKADITLSCEIFAGGSVKILDKSN